MTADAQGNDLTAVKYVTSSKIIIAPYDPTAKLTASMIAKTVADPITTLKDIFSKGHAVGLINQRRPRRRTRETPMTPPNSTRPGYMLNADPNLTLAFTVAEDNETVRGMTIGNPRCRRRLSRERHHPGFQVDRLPGNALQEPAQSAAASAYCRPPAAKPAQDTRGEVSGIALTTTWQKDSIVDNGNSRYLQSYYMPTTTATETGK